MGYTAKRLTDDYPEKSWTKLVVNKLLKKLQDSGTVDRRPDSGRPRSAHTEENVETISEPRGHAPSGTNFLSTSCPRC